MLAVLTVIESWRDLVSLSLLTAWRQRQNQDYEGMKDRESKIPANEKFCLTQALERLPDLYTAWDKPEEAAKWQALLDTAKAETEKAEE